MQKIIKNLYKFIIILFCAVALIMPGMLSAAVPTAKAESETTLAFEGSNVLDDLRDTTVDGQPFDFSKYSYSVDGKPQVLSFIEYGFGATAELMGNFGLYVYVYNPQGLVLDAESPLNTIQIGKGYPASTYSKYQLKFLNFSEEQGCIGLFYKFKVVLSEEQKATFTSKPTAAMRTYNVGEIELITVGATTADAYSVSATFRYSGYAEGYDPAQEESTLQCISDAMETLSLDVHPTVYRPTGSNGKNEYTQDSLHSVYFAVLNSMLDRYGNLSKVHAQWLNAVLKPALVTGNQDAYKAIDQILGRDVKDAEFDYIYVGAHENVPKLDITVTGETEDECGFTYFEKSTGLDLQRRKYGYDINRLYMLFNAGNFASSADYYVVKSSDLLEKLKDSKTKFGGELVNGKYAKSMFESVDEEFTEVNISADTNFSLTSQKIDRNFWDKLFGTQTVTTKTFDGIKAIQAVTEEDVAGGEHDVSERLYISTADVVDFINFYNDSKEQEKTVFLFRYQVSDYVSQEATLFEEGFDIVILEAAKKIDTNAYFFQETVNLDFDIIDVTFSTGLEETVIACVSSPIDVIGPGTPPINTTPDKIPFEWMVVVVSVVLIAGCCAGAIVFRKLGGQE